MLKSAQWLVWISLSILHRPIDLARVGYLLATPLLSGRRKRWPLFANAVSAPGADKKVSAERFSRCLLDLGQTNDVRLKPLKLGKQWHGLPGLRLVPL